MSQARLCDEYKWTRPMLAVARNSQTIQLLTWVVVVVGFGGGGGGGDPRPPSPVICKSHELY